MSCVIFPNEEASHARIVADVLRLRQLGMSQRAIGKALSVGHMTVRRALDLAGVPNKGKPR